MRLQYYVESSATAVFYNKGENRKKGVLIKPYGNFRAKVLCNSILTVSALSVSEFYMICSHRTVELSGFCTITQPNPLSQWLAQSVWLIRSDKKKQNGLQVTFSQNSKTEPLSPKKTDVSQLLTQTFMVCFVFIMSQRVCRESSVMFRTLHENTD